MRTDLHGDIPGRQRLGHQRPVVLTPAIGSLPITAREVSPACLLFKCGCAGLVPLDPTLPYHPSAAVTDSMSQRPSFVLQLTCVLTRAVLSLVLMPNDNLNLNH